MGYELRRWFEDRLPQEISSGERVVALAIADLAWDDSRIAYGRKFMEKLLHKTGFENEAQVGKVLGKLAARGIELRVPICGDDGKPLRNKRGQLVYAHRGHQRTFRIPFASEFPGRTAPHWDDEGDQSPDRDVHAWHDGERSPGREAFSAERSPVGEGFEGERSPGRETNRGERSPARESMVTQAGDPIPLTTPTFPPSSTPRGSDSARKVGGRQSESDLAAAAEFLMNLPAPWTVGRVTAKGTAPLLLEAISEQGWRLDERLAAKLTENSKGVHRPSSVLRIRINDLPKAPKPAVPKVPPKWPPYCGDLDCDEKTRLRQREDDNGLRSVYPCPECHPSRKESAA